MAEKTLTGRRVAILAADGFESKELFEPMKALEDAGARVSILSLKKDPIRAWEDKDWSDDEVKVDALVSEADINEYDALMLPGGVINPDTLRQDDSAVSFVRSMAEAGKPIAAICHAPQMLVEADVVGGRKVTSYPSVKTDLINAGAEWVDEPVVVDQGIVTSRKPADIPAFNEKMIEEFAEGLHERQFMTHLTEAERMSLQ